MCTCVGVKYIIIMCSLYVSLDIRVYVFRSKIRKKLQINIYIKYKISLNFNCLQFYDLYDIHRNTYVHRKYIIYIYI